MVFLPGSFPKAALVEAKVVYPCPLLTASLSAVAGVGTTLLPWPMTG